MKLKPLLKVFGILTLIVLMGSCKKTENIDPPAQSQSRMLSYQVSNVSGDPIKGVINDTEKTIKLYLPYYLYLTVLQPDIKVSEGAVVNPASGTLVENLLDLFDQNKNTSYTVTGKDGTKSTYKLLIEVQQGDFKLEEISTATVTTELVVSRFENPALYIPWSGDIPSGNIELDRSLIKITLIDEAQKEFVINNNSGYKLFATSSALTYNLLTNTFTDFKSGVYKIKVRFYSKTVALKYPVKITVK